VGCLAGVLNVIKCWNCIPQSTISRRQAARHWFHVSYPGKTVTKGIREGGGRGGG